MLFETAVARVKLRLGNNNLASLDALIEAEMQTVQDTTLEGGSFLPWFLWTEIDTLVTISGTRTVAFPSDFLLEADEGVLSRFGTVGDDSTLVELKKEEYDILIDQYPGSGKPTHYAVVGESIALFPKPDAVFTLRFHYYGQATALTTGVENGWLKHANDWLIAETGLIIAGQYLQSKKMVEIFAVQATKAEERLLNRHTAMMEANTVSFMGG